MQKSFGQLSELKPWGWQIPQLSWLGSAGTNGPPASQCSLHRSLQLSLQLSLQSSAEPLAARSHRAHCTN